MMSGTHQRVKDTMDRGSQCDIWRKLETSSAIGDIVSNMKKTGGDIVSDMKKTGENIVKSKDVIRNVIENILNEVVKERDAAVDEDCLQESLPTDTQNRCFKMLEGIIARRKPRKFITISTRRNTKNINHMMLDMIIVRMQLLDINMKIQKLRDKLKVKQGNMKIDEKKPIIAVKGRIRNLKEDSIEVPVLSRTRTMEETNQDIDDSNEAQINLHDLAPEAYPWSEISNDLGNSEMPDLVPDLTSNDCSDESSISEKDEVEILTVDGELEENERNPVNDDGDDDTGDTEEDDSDEVQILRGPTPTPEVVVNGRRYAQRTIVTERGMGVQRREISSSQNEDGENWILDSPSNEDGENDEIHRTQRFFTPPNPAEEIAFDNHGDSDDDGENWMRRANNYRDWERRRQRSRASSSDSDDLDRIRHRSQYNPRIRTIRCPEVEELNFCTRQMRRMCDRTNGRQSCHCSSSSDCDRSDDVAVN